MPTKRTTDKPVISTSAGTAAAPARSKSTAAKRAPRATAGVETFNETVLAVAVPAIPESQPVVISQEAIACLAFALWESRGRQGGSPEEDWLSAEQQLRAASAK